MKKTFITLTGLVLVGCAVEPIKEYSEPATGPQAQVAATGSLIGLFSGGKQTHLEIYTGCYNESPANENVLGNVVFMQEEFKKKLVKVPAGERLYFRYGTDDPNWDCHVSLSFVPEENRQYLFGYSMKFAGCQGSIADTTTNKPVDVKWYRTTEKEKWMGDPKTGWRKCEYLNK